MEIRRLDQLVDLDAPAWPLVLEWIAEANPPAEVLPVDRSDGERALLALQVSSHSPLGAIALESGGILFSGGWLRLLGAGTNRMKGSLLTWNGLADVGVSPPLGKALLVAHDAVGGFFAIEGDSTSSQVGLVRYFAPDSLQWEDLDIGYAQFVQWAAMGDLEAYYASVRWPGWEQDVAGLEPDQGFSVYPFMWAEGPPIGERSRRAVPMTELWGLNQEMAAQIFTRETGP